MGSLLGPVRWLRCLLYFRFRAGARTASAAVEHRLLRVAAPSRSEVTWVTRAALAVTTSPGGTMAHKGMKFGIFLAPFHRVGENPTLALGRDMELIEWLDHLGYDEVWIGEHPSAGWELIAAPEIFIGAAAERTRHIMLGSG